MHDAERGQVHIQTPARMILVFALLGGRLAAAAAAAQMPPAPAPPTRSETERKVPSLDPRLNAAFQLIKAGRFAQARQAAQHYLASGTAAHPGQAQFILGLSYHRERLYENARARFAEAVAAEPG
jgi:TolA-binding protein